MSFIQNLFTSRDNSASGNVYIGQLERIWWNPDTNAFYYSDGNTPGGILITGGTSGNGVPGGTINQVQINNGSGGFTGSTNLSFDGTLLNIVGNIAATGNVNANYFIGNGSQLTGIDRITSPDTLWTLSITSGGLINFPGGVTFNNNDVFTAATNMPIGINNRSNTTAVRVEAASGVNVYAGNVGDTQYRWNFDTTGNLTLPGNSDVAINYANGVSILSGLYGNSDVAAYLPTYTGNIRAGNISASGNITGNYFFGNGSQLTGLPQQYSNANVAAYLPTYSGNLAGGNISVTGNSTAAYYFGNGSQLTGMYGNANVATYLTTYSGNIAGGNILSNNYLYANGNSIFANVALSGNVNLGNLYIIDETIYGKNLDQDIVLSPGGTGFVSVPKLSFTNGNIVSTTVSVPPIIDELTLNAILDYSTGPTDDLLPPAYGISSTINAPWSVYQFTTTPSPVLQTNDVASGTGIPVPSVINFVGTGGNANVVITNKTFDGLGTPVPTTGALIEIVRPETLAALTVTTPANTSIFLDPGSDVVVINGSLIPNLDNQYDLGSPLKRFNASYFGPGTIYILDDVLNIDLSINASAGNLVVGGGTGLDVGEFVLSGNTIYLQNPAEDFFLGTIGATGNLTVNRQFNVNAGDGSYKLFDVDQGGGFVSVKSNISTSTGQAALEVIGSEDQTQIDPQLPGVLIHTTGTNQYPSRFYNDSFGTNNYAAYIGRKARGTASTPAAAQAGDVISRLGANPFDNSGNFAPISTTRVDFVSASNQTPTDRGSRIEFWNTPIGSNIIGQVASMSDTDLVFKPSANRGITFADSTRQTTAWIPANNVNSLTAASGITLSSNTGNITIGTTAVLGVIGTTNQINVSNVGNVLTLSLPQNFNTTANVQLYSLTVTDLNVLGNVSNITPEVIGGKIVYVANTANALSGIDVSGLVTGNAANGYYAGMLYSTSSNTWQMDIGNSVGITAGNVYAANITADGLLHVGNAYNDYDFPNAIIQGDIDIDSYGQFVLKNHSQTANASSDIVAVANNGDDSSFYIDMGINSNVYANPDYAVTSFNDGYLYVNGGNLVIGTQTPTKVINFITGGTSNLNQIRGTISDTGLSMVGNVAGGNIISTALVQGTTVSATGNVVGANVNATGNVTGGNITTTGQVTATGNIIGGNVTTSGRITATGNIVTSANLVTSNTIINGIGVSTTGNVTGNYVFGNGSQLTGLNAFRTVAANGTNLLANSVASILTLTPGNNLVITGNATSATATVAVNDAPTFTGNVTGGNITTSGRITATGNIVTSANLVTSNTIINGIGVSTTGNVTGNYVFGNGSQLTGMYGNANVAAYLPTYTGNITGNNISAVGNITGNYILGNGSQLTGMYGDANVATYLPTYTGALAALTGNVTTTANVTANYVIASGGNTVINAGVSTTGNVTGNYFIGDGSQLTGLPPEYGNANVAAYLPTYTGNISVNSITGNGVFSTSGNVIGAWLIASNGNTVIDSGVSTTGNVTGAYVIASGGNTVINAGVSTTGNVTGNYFVGNGSQLTGIAIGVSSLAAGNNIILSGSTGAVTIQRIDGLQNVITGNSAATASLATTDQYFGTTRSATGTGTITLPLGSAVLVGRQYVIKDEGGNSGSALRRITVASSGADTIDGSATRNITSNYGSLTVIWTGTRWSAI